MLDGRQDERSAAFVDAIRQWRDLGLEFEAAMCALTLVTMVGPAEPEARDAADQARLVFERIGANLHLVLLEQAMAATPGARPAPRDARTAGDVRASATRGE
jgi:hypothetical protein